MGGARVMPWLKARAASCAGRRAAWRPPWPSRSGGLLALCAWLVLTPLAVRAELVVPPLPEASVLDEPAAAKAYDLAAKLAQRKRFAEALSEAERSFALAPNAQRAALVGAIDIELGRTREALEKLIVAVNLDQDFKLEDYVFKRLAALPPFEPSDIGVARFQISPATATCTLAATGERFELGPRRIALGLPAGRQAVTCEAPGMTPMTVELAVLPRRVVTASVTLVPVPVVIAPDPKLPEDPPVVVPDPGAGVVGQKVTRGGGSALPVVLMVGGAVILGGGVGLHLWAFDAADEAAAAADDASLDRDEARVRYQQASDAAELRQGLAFGAYAVGLVAVGAGVILLVSDDDDDAHVVMPWVDHEHVGASWAFGF